MGVVSRRVLPACGNLCFLCPSLRTRSRQPVKRYKKFLNDIFPRSPEGEANERMIGKLCEYCSKNPVRIPKITKYLEKRCYKELRNEHFYHAKVVPCIYRKMLASCKEQMPLFATSLLCIILTLLDQTRQDDMLVLGCHTLVDFIDGQMDSTYMFNIEAFIPKLCQLGREGSDERGLQLRSAALQALASLVQFMGKYSHISKDFDDIVSVIVDNCEVSPEIGRPDLQCTPSQNHLGEKVLREQDSISSFRHSLRKASSLHVRTKPAGDGTMDISKNPAYWSSVCLHNMAKLAMEATTVRRVLDPLFRCFDSGNYWSSDKGVALSILSEMQFLIEKSGQNSHLLLSILVKHLDHKNVAKQPDVQGNIVKVLSYIAMHTSKEASVAIITAVGDLMRHLRKCMQGFIESSDLGDNVNKKNSALYSALEEGLIQLSNKVGDIGPILDIMAVLLENIPTTAVLARTTISSIYRTAQIAASIPNISYNKKAFPENLFHQLLLAMTHSDHETRVGSHRVFSAVLVPHVVCPWSVSVVPFSPKGYDPLGTLSIALSGFSSSSSRGISEVKRSVSIKNLSLEDSEKSDVGVGIRREKFQLENADAKWCRIYPYHSESHCPKLSSVCTASDGKVVTEAEKEELSLRLNSHQVELLLSSIWVQATLQDNVPANFEAMAHTYKIALLFSQTKTRSHVALASCFQLAFSLRSVSLDHESRLQPSCRRSLFTLASSMLVFSAMASELPELVTSVKALTIEKMVDPHLRLVGDSSLQVSSGKEIYGSEEDRIAASKFLEEVERDDKPIKQTVITHVMGKFEKLPEEELLGIKEQLSKEFLPDDSVPIGAQLSMETLNPRSALVQKDIQTFDEVMLPTFLEDEDAFAEASDSQLECKTTLSMNALDILSVNQLMDSIHDTERRVANLSLLPILVPFEQMARQCEALSTQKKEKMLVLQSFKHRPNVLPVESDELQEDTSTADVISPKGQDHCCNSLPNNHGKALILPSTSPYDKFLKVSGS